MLLTFGRTLKRLTYLLMTNDADLLNTLLKDSPPPLTAVPDQLHVTTVRQNYDGFTKKQIDQVTTASGLMGMIRSRPNATYKVWFVSTS